MHSIMDEIREAEEQAEKLRQDTLQKVRDESVAFKAAGEKALQELESNEREETAKALADAEKQGEELAGAILKELADAAKADCDKADAKMDAAGKYLLEKVLDFA